MAEIIKFDNSINESNKELKDIFNDILFDVRTKRKNLDIDSEDINKDLDFLEKYVANILIKLNTGNWKTNKTEEKFIEIYHYFKEAFKDSDELWKSLSLMELVYVTDVNPSILSENNEYVESVIKAIDSNADSFELSDKNMINDIVNKLKKPIIKKLFNENIDKLKMENVVEAIIDGEDILTIYSWYNTEGENDDIKEQGLDNGILTLNKVRDYYLEQVQGIHELKGYSYQRNDGYAPFEDEEYARNVSSISKIVLLKHYPEDYKELYLRIVRAIKDNKNLLDQINDVVKLTDFYIENGENITNFNENDIMLYMINGPEEKSDKIENRRL